MTEMQKCFRNSMWLLGTDEIERKILQYNYNTNNAL